MLKATLTAAALVSILSPLDAMAFGSKRLGQALDPERSGKIQASTSVPARQVDLLRKDFSWLRTLNNDSDSSRLALTMGLYDASPESLEHWLYDRVHYMLSEDFKPNLWNVSPVLGSSFEYPNPDVLPDFEQPQPGLQSLAALNDEAKVVMANLGSALYMAGKSSKILLAAKVDGVGKVQVTSPRTGIIMVGEGLFFDGYFPPGTAADAPVKSAFRMATFFHEARHSDGNGKSLGFVHALCPEGHDYAGLNACDRNTNGAYSVGAAIEAHMASNCNDCSEQEREALRVMSLDSTSRIIPRKDGQPADRWDASPEGNRERP